ncbi:MAG: DUF1489 domain-containing protein [Rhodobacteraceae bacterium]|nr:DUF1489 domain-containing protein [Paracoccaceae bacterium]
MAQQIKKAENTTATAPKLHLVKLCVGAEEVEDLTTWQTARAVERSRRGLDPRPRHTTRMFPRRADELLAGGSLYWVFRGVIRARQALVAIEPVTGEDGVSRHDLVLSPDVVLTEPCPRRPFQGWRYLAPKDAPADLSHRSLEKDAALPLSLREAVADYGVL